MENIVVSACGLPEMEQDEVLRAYSDLGYKKFEVFTTWTKSAFDFNRDPKFYLEKGRQYGMSFTSLHLPSISDDLPVSLANAVKIVRFAKAIGVSVVIFWTDSRENYIRVGKSFLDAIERLNVTPVIENHAGGAISTLQDFREVLEGLNDERMKVLLEVGEFHSVGVSWKEGYDLLGDKIALIHIKDQIGAQSVPFGTGEIDLPGLFKHMKSVVYTGDYVVEMYKLKDKENTLKYYAEALQYLRNNC